jgi:hypothetical protein
MRSLFFIILILFAAPAVADQTPVSRIKKVKHTVLVTQIKMHLPRSLKPFVTVIKAEDDHDNDDSFDLQVAYRRPDLVDNNKLPLSDYVQLRLANARRLALDEYRRIWG